MPVTCPLTLPTPAACAGVAARTRPARTTSRTTRDRATRIMRTFSSNAPVVSIPRPGELALATSGAAAPLRDHGCAADEHETEAEQHERPRVGAGHRQRPA